MNARSSTSSRIGMNLRKMFHCSKLYERFTKHLHVCQISRNTVCRYRPTCNTLYPSVTSLKPDLLKHFTLLKRSASLSGVSFRSYVDSKHISEENDQNRNSANAKELLDKDFVMIYKNPHMPIYRVLVMLKFYQIAATIVTGLIGGVFVANGSWTGVQLAVVMFNLTSMIPLSVLPGLYGARSIGNMAIDKDFTVLRVQHLSHTGKRNTLYFDPDDIIQLGDLQLGPNSVRLKLGDVPLQTYNLGASNKLFFNFKIGFVFDEKLFGRIFGNYR